MNLGKRRWRLYDDARAEIFAGHNETTEEEYIQRVEKACSFLEGKTKDWLSELRDEMNSHAQAMDFERAAQLRDLSNALAQTIKRNRRFSRTCQKLKRMILNCWKTFPEIGFEGCTQNNRML